MIGTSTIAAITDYDFMSGHQINRCQVQSGFGAALQATSNSWPHRVLVYCHDLFGMGNLKRMLLLCQHMLAANEKVSILLVSGNANIHRFELPQRLDYIKIPCLTRSSTGQVGAKFLNSMSSEVVSMRSGMIAVAARTFKPDLFIVDKKPRGAANELDATFHYLRRENTRCRRILLLRDILDTPRETIAIWHQNGYYEDAEEHFDRIYVAGERHIFDVAEAYQFPDALCARTEYCGYLQIIEQPRSRSEVLQSLQLDERLPLVLVTVGGGEDGFHILDRYLDALARSSANLQSLLVCGPELPIQEFQYLKRRASSHSFVKVLRFSDDMVSLANAADLVVSMAGYNTICKLMTFAKPAVVIPRVEPSQEQWLRANLLAKRGYLSMLPPDCSPEGILAAVNQQLTKVRAHRQIDFYSQQTSSVRIDCMVRALFQDSRRPLRCHA